MRLFNSGTRHMWTALFVVGLLLFFGEFTQGHGWTAAVALLLTIGAALARGAAVAEPTEEYERRH